MAARGLSSSTASRSTGAFISPARPICWKKWLNRKVSIAELHGFHGKIEQKAAWARGLFVSFGGFTNQGLDAFGSGKKLVCMEGREIKIALEREIGIDALIAMKVRRGRDWRGLHANRNSLPE
jgi:hypothetical protein